MRILLLTAMLMGACSKALAQDVVAVLSSELSVYGEALDGFTAAYGSTVPVLSYGNRGALPEGTRVVVAFGSRAAFARYPSGTRVIAVAAPGAEWGRRPKSMVVIRMLPPPGRLTQAARRAFSRVTNVGVVWSGPVFDGYMETLQREAKPLGLELRLQRVESEDDLPGVLRRWEGKVEALWLPPDPSLITQRNFRLIADYARSTGIQLYTSTPGLTERGAHGCLGVSFRSTGELAAETARKALAGEELPRFVYAKDIDVFLFPSATSASGSKSSK